MRALLRFCSLVLASAALFLLPGCHYRSPKDTYYLVSTNLKVPYWKAVADGFDAAAQQYGVSTRIVGPDTYDPNAEVSALRDAPLPTPSAARSRKPMLRASL